MARLWVSNHASERFRDRFCPGYPLSHARREVRALAEHAIRTEQRLLRGAEAWVAGTNGEVILVVKMDRREHKRLPTNVTVLHAQEIEEPGLEAAE